MPDIGLERLGEFLRTGSPKGEGEFLHHVEHVGCEFSKARRRNVHRDGACARDAALRQMRDLVADEPVLVRIRLTVAGGSGSQPGR